MSTARTKLDVIYEDVLGDIQELINRIESSTEVLNLLHENNKKAVDDAREAIDMASKKAAMTIRNEVKENSVELLKQLDKARGDVSNSANIVQKSSSKFLMFALIGSSAFGFIGGVLAVYALQYI